MKNNKNNAVIENKKVYHDYFVEETLECGIELRGNEVKSIRNGMASIKESWVSIENNQIYIKKMHITKWDTSNQFDVDETRERRLLAHKNEIRELGKKVCIQGYTLMPIKVYFVNGRAKLLVGLCKGKHNYDKRAVEKEKQIKKYISMESR